MTLKNLALAIWPPLPVWRRLDLTVLGIAAYTALVEYIAISFQLKLPKWIGDVGVINALILGVLLGFRNLQAYDRWWEARKLWGQLINDSRNFCLKLNAFVPDLSAEHRLRFAEGIAGFALTLKRHLRGHRETPHGPAAAAAALFAQVQSQRPAPLADINYLVLDPHLKGLMEICGACERIQNSPVPPSYRALLRHGTILYLASAPWFLTTEYGYYAVGMVGLMAYFLLGIEFTAEDVEDPFGTDGDDLALGRYCETIRKSAIELLGAGTADPAGSRSA
jgi:ion channel-forming bestrophin family protein